MFQQHLLYVLVTVLFCKQIALASHVPEVAETYPSVTQDTGGWM